MFTDRLKWAFRLLRSRTFVLLTDKAAVVHLPIVDIESADNRYILGGQTASLQEFKSRLEALIEEHEQAIELLAYRQSRAADNRTKGKKASPRTDDRVRKTTKGRSS